MKRLTPAVTMTVCIMMILSVLAYAEEPAQCATSAPVCAAKEERAPSEYDDISWKDINKKRENRDKNLFQKIYTYFFKEETVETYHGDEVTVVQTMTSSNNSNDAPDVNIVHIQ